MKNNKTATFFIVFLVIILGVYLYLVDGINVENIIAKSINKLTANNSTTPQSQKGEAYESQFMQSYYLTPKTNLYNTKTLK